MTAPTILSPGDLDPPHVFLGPAEVFLRYGWKKSKGYEMLQAPGFPRRIGGKYRFDTLLAWEERELLGLNTPAAAVQPAEPEQMRRPFGDAPRQLRRLLRIQPGLATASAWLTPTAVAVPAPRRPPDTIVRQAQPVTAEFTERELEVLRHLDQMHSTQELASAMFISVNSVRTHIRNILRKLSATRRTDAARYAKQLEII